MEAERASTSMRILYIVLGLVALALGIVVLIDPPAGLDLLGILLVVGLLLNGVVSIVMAIASKELPGVARVLGVITGVLALILFALVLAIPGIELRLIVIFLAIGLLFWGINRITLDGANPDLPGGFRALGVVVGILALVMSFMALAFPIFALSLAVAFLGVGLIFGGIGAIASGATGAKMQMTAPLEAG